MPSSFPAENRLGSIALQGFPEKEVPKAVSSPTNCATYGLAWKWFTWVERWFHFPGSNRKVYFDAFYYDKAVNIFCLRSFKCAAFYQLFRLGSETSQDVVNLLEFWNFYCFNKMWAYSVANIRFMHSTHHKLSYRNILLRTKVENKWFLKF